MLWYKVLNVDGTPFHGGQGAWELPTTEQPGAWREVTGPLVACTNGLHLCQCDQLIRWLGPAIFTCEYSGEAIHYGDKIVARKARLHTRLLSWNEYTQRMFAADCAERALLGASVQDWDVPTICWEAIEAVRNFAGGTNTRQVLASYYHQLFRYIANGGPPAVLSTIAAVSSIAPYAALFAALYADMAFAAKVTERSWQTARLFEYLEGGR